MRLIIDTIDKKIEILSPVTFTELKGFLAKIDDTLDYEIISASPSISFAPMPPMFIPEGE